MFDDNCTLHTAAAICNHVHRTQLNVSLVSHYTGLMEGPAHGLQNIASMFQSLNIGDGTYAAGTNAVEMEAALMTYPTGTMFGVACAPLDGSTGHMIAALRGLGRIEYRDYQIRERQGPYVPIGTDLPANCLYHVFKPSMAARGAQHSRPPG